MTARKSPTTSVATETNTQVVFIKIDGTGYRGILDGNTFKGTKTMDLAKYIEERETGALQTLIIGDARNLVIAPLTDEEQLDLDRFESLWKLAEKKSKAWVTCQVFSKLAGK